MDLEALQYILLLLAIVVWSMTHGRKLWRRWQLFKAWEVAQTASGSEGLVGIAPAASAAVSAPDAPISNEVLAGAGRALAQPPADLTRNIAELRRVGATGPYTFPLGWRRSAANNPSLVYGSFVGDVNHVALTGFTDSGKDSWATQALLYLALTNPPERLQVAILDGKGGLSWIGWGDKQHVCVFAEEKDELAPAMTYLKTVREQRQRQLKAAGCEKWEEYEGVDMPLMVAFVSELMLLQDAVGKNELSDWLNTELTSARASGIRYIISSQTFTRLDTRWRSQIGLYVAGYQPRQDADEPNTSFSTKELREHGTREDGMSVGVPPSELPVPPTGSGVFTCVQGRNVLTVRASHLPKQHRQYLLGRLPQRQKALQSLAQQPMRHAAASADDAVLLHLLRTNQPLPLEPALPTTGKPLTALPDAVNSSSVSTNGNGNGKPAVSVGVALDHLPLPEDQVPAEEQRRILAAARKATSRADLCQVLYGVKAGRPYDRMKRVLDAAGLLVKEPASA